MAGDEPLRPGLQQRVLPAAHCRFPDAFDQRAAAVRPAEHEHDDQGNFGDNTSESPQHQHRPGASAQQIQPDGQDHESAGIPFTLQSVTCFFDTYSVVD